MKSSCEIYNKEITVLMGLGMIFVVVGHKGGISLFSEWFPFYSFHMQLFMFIAGRLFKEKYIYEIPLYIKNKIRHLLIPYYLNNFVYCIIAFVCCKYYQFTFIDKKYFSGLNYTFFKTFFIEPFYTGHQYVFNLPAWFVPQLFLIQIASVLIIYIFNPKHKLFNDIIIIAVLLFGGVMNLYFIKTSGLDQTLIRTIYLLPFFFLGYIYQKRLVKYDHFNSYYYFLTLFLIQASLIFTTRLLKYKLITTIVVFNKYTPGCILSFIVPLVGIAFWTRVARLLTPVLSKSKPFMYLGKNTWTVMMHHMFVFFLCNCIVCQISEAIPFQLQFNTQKFHSSIWYYYPIIGKLTGLLYCVAGLSIPLIVKYNISNFKKKLINRMHYNNLALIVNKTRNND